MEYIGSIHGEYYCRICRDYRKSTANGICDGCRTVKFFKGYTPPNYLKRRGDKYGQEQSDSDVKKLPIV